MKPPATSITPDWTTQAEEIHCPLCEYNLRGLTAPRCPECGYAFDWPDLLDPSRRKHPYLFEHHPERNVWSFFATLLGGLRPFKFWRTLRPSMPSRPRRLVVYWVLSISFLVMIVAGDFISYTRMVNNDLTKSRKIMLQQYKRWQGPIVDYQGIRHPSAQAFIDSLYPPPWSSASWKLALEAYAGNDNNSLLITGGQVRLIGEAVPAMITIVLWPWVTFLVLMIFQQSMRRAKVRPIHVLRTVLYGCDMAWLIVVAIVVGVIVYHWTDRDEMLTLTALLLAGFMALRLWAAYGRYLKVRHAIGVAIVSQMIMLLTLLVVVANVPWIW